MKQDGFSLIEVMVALSISAMIGLSGVVLLHQALMSGERIEALADRNTEIQSAHKLMLLDFGNATNAPSKQGNGAGMVLGFDAGKPGDTRLVGFLRTGWSNPGLRDDRSDLLRVEYSLEQGALIRRTWLRPDATDLTPQVERRVLSDIQRVTPRFLSNGQWFGNWSQGRPGMPDAVEFSVQLRNGQSLRLVYAVGVGR